MLRLCCVGVSVSDPEDEAWASGGRGERNGVGVGVEILSPATAAWALRRVRKARGWASPGDVSSTRVAMVVVTWIFELGLRGSGLILREGMMGVN